VKGDKVRACFLDRCWQESQTQCGDWSTSSSSISLWMQVTCEIADHVIPRKALHVVPYAASVLSPLTIADESSWEDFQTFGPTGITQM